ncbi:MAG: pantetheine-phosphate adenylyltransferase [Thermoplasmataceae archaeon]
MTLIVGGTFAVIHSGHRLMFSEAARSGQDLVIGLTTDEFIRGRKAYKVPEYSKRKENLEKYLSPLVRSFRILPLATFLGNASESRDYNAIIVSPETYHNAAEINRRRKASTLPPLEIKLVPHVLANDMMPVSSGRIITGEIDENGKRLVPLRVVLSSGNPVKADVVRRFFTEKGLDVDFHLNRKYKTVSEQPFSTDTLKFAEARARSVESGFDYSIGVESGLVRIGEGTYDFHACSVLDRNGYLSSGFSSGFRVPGDLVHMVKQGMDISAAYSKLHGEKNIGSEGGIVSILSDSSLKRSQLVMESIRNAFVPRMRPDMYIERL